jgi:hypothetical protein
MKNKGFENVTCLSSHQSYHTSSICVEYVKLGFAADRSYQMSTWQRIAIDAWRRNFDLLAVPFDERRESAESL